MDAPSPVFPTKYYPSQRRIIRVSPKKMTSWRKNFRKLQKDIRSLPPSPETHYVTRPPDAIADNSTTTSKQSLTRGLTFPPGNVAEKPRISENMEEFSRRACPILKIPDMSSSSVNPSFSQSSNQSERSSRKSLFGTPEENILDVRILFRTMKMPLRVRSAPRCDLSNPSVELIKFGSRPSIKLPETGNAHFKTPELPLPLESRRISSSSLLSVKDPRRYVTEKRSVYYVEPVHVTIPPRITSQYFEKSQDISSDTQGTSSTGVFTRNDSSDSLLSTTTPQMILPEQRNADNLYFSQKSSQSEKSSHGTLFGTSEENILDARILFPFTTFLRNDVTEPPVFDTPPSRTVAEPQKNSTEPPEPSTPKSFEPSQHSIRSSDITSLEILQTLRKRGSPSDVDSTSNVDSDEAVPNIKFYRVAETRLRNATSVQQTSHNKKSEFRSNKNEEKRHKLSKKIRKESRTSVTLSPIHNVPRKSNQGNVEMYTSVTRNDINVYDTSSESGLGSSLNRSSTVTNNINQEESRNLVRDESNATTTRIIPKMVPQPESRISHCQDIDIASSNQVEHQELVVDYDNTSSPIAHESGIDPDRDVDSTIRNIRDKPQVEYDLGLSSTSDGIVSVTQKKRMPTVCPTSQSQVRARARRTDKLSRSSLFLEFLSDYIRKRDCPPEVFYFKNDFLSTREELCDKLFRIFNRKIFASHLPRNILFVWNERRYATRSVCGKKKISHRGKRTLQIELSSKLIKTTGILRDTVIYELCNAAAWLLDESGNPLGAIGITSSSTQWAWKAVQTFPIVSGLYSISQTFATFNMESHYVCIDCEKKVRYRSHLPNAIRCTKCDVFYFICSKFPNLDYASPYRAATCRGGPLYDVPPPAYLPHDERPGRKQSLEYWRK